jgi:hypothetical protein
VNADERVTFVLVHHFIPQRFRDRAPLPVQENPKAQRHCIRRLRTVTTKLCFQELLVERGFGFRTPTVRKTLRLRFFQAASQNFP